MALKAFGLLSVAKVAIVFIWKEIYNTVKYTKQL